MAIDHVIAVVPVTDIEVARAWYARLFGREPNNQPMENLVEWKITEGGWVQVFVDPERAGSAFLNFAVDDLSSHIEELRHRGLAPQPIEQANKGVELSSIPDPDGNTITYIGNFRVNY